MKPRIYVKKNHTSFNIARKFWNWLEISILAQFETFLEHSIGDEISTEIKIKKTIPFRL